LRLQHELLLVVLLPPALRTAQPLQHLLQARLRLWRGGPELCRSFLRRSGPELCGSRADLCGAGTHLCRSCSDLCGRPIVRHRPELWHRPELRRLQHLQPGLQPAAQSLLPSELQHRLQHLQAGLQQLLPSVPARPPVLLPSRLLEAELRLCGSELRCCCSQLWRSGSQLWRSGSDLCRSCSGLRLRCPDEGCCGWWPGCGSHAAGPGG
jgi:hypothetical protein